MWRQHLILFATLLALWYTFALHSRVDPSSPDHKELIRRSFSLGTDDEIASSKAADSYKGTRGLWPQLPACDKKPPRSIVYYCFDTPQLAQRLAILMQGALQTWAPALYPFSSLSILPAPQCVPFDGTVKSHECICTTPGIDKLNTLIIRDGYPARCTLGWTNMLNPKDPYPNHMTFQARNQDSYDPAYMPSGYAGDKWEKRAAHYKLHLAHELGHAIGLAHEHQRPGVYDVFNPNSPYLILNIEHLPGYAEAKTKVAAAWDEIAFRGLSQDERLKAVLRDKNLGLKYWDSSVSSYREIQKQEMTERGLIETPSFDYDSVMLYTSALEMWEGTTLGDPKTQLLNARASTINYDGTEKYSWIWRGGSTDPRLGSVSEGDIARVRKMYPLPPGSAPPARRDAAANTTLAFKPFKLIVGNVTTTIRPAPLQTPVYEGSDEAKKLWLDSGTTDAGQPDHGDDVEDDMDD
ncbi:hypothetical protein B0A48_17296 [Cryoendolithus antarcticus]|uniref:Peptidase M12A domain-containing protein n=1 Tax=Cryoendolithus antarcticus TaxID=1507870 RepID=A0A1V8SBY2_9PEZI|nr:hypothetical protein B0A48_17296 [Cryoendolithus antarcticus]